MKWFSFRSGVPYTCRDCPAYSQVHSDVERWRSTAIAFAQKSREVSNQLIAERNEAIRQRDQLYRIAEMFYLHVDGADDAFVDYEMEQPGRCVCRLGKACPEHHDPTRD